jgi:GMP synthase (glutamine-hydrolysing)
MKKILLIDTIVEDRSLSQARHIREILGRDYAAVSFLEIHPATEGPRLDLLAREKPAAAIFSGSVRSVYDDFYWKKDLDLLFEAVLKADIPVLANCFGAQFLAQQLGAKVSKNPRGTEFGPIRISLTDEGAGHPLLSVQRDKYVFASHGDIVETLPAGARLLAYNENSPIQAYQYGKVLATQFHSDIPLSCAQYLLDKRKEQYLREGMLRDEADYQTFREKLSLVGESHTLLKSFLENPDLAGITCPGG